MPGTVDYLTDKLMRGVDAEGNILDITVVMEVVRDLERTVITAEDLKMTHLGRIVNETRRKITDKSLARRMKSLVKQWLKLASGLNGAAIEDKMSAKSTPSPSSSDVTRRSTVQPQPPVLSHTTPTTQTTPPMQHTSAAGYSSKFLHIPSNVPRLPSSDSIDSRAFQPVNGQSYNKTLVVRIPRVQLQPQEKKQEQKALNELQQDHHEPVPAPVTPITSLIVRIPLKHVRFPWDYVTPPPVCVSPPVPSKLVVSIQLSEHVSLRPTHSSPSPLFSSTLNHTAADVPHPVKHVQAIPPVFINPIPSEPYPRMQSPVRLKSYSNIVPDDSVIGIDGVVGSDNYWHGWAECIPGESLTVLPYVYIDGLSGYNEDQIWSSLDRQELTDCLQQHMS